MLLVNINDVHPGVVLGAAVTDPRAPELTLLRPGVVLDASMLASVRRRGVTQLWVEDDLTKDLDAAVAPELIAARVDVYRRLRDDLKGCAGRTITVSSLINPSSLTVMKSQPFTVVSPTFASKTRALCGWSSISRR